MKLQHNLQVVVEVNLKVSQLQDGQYNATSKAVNNMLQKLSTTRY